MPDKKFELGDYVEVKDRITLFYELFGQGRLVTGEVRLTSEPDGVPRVLVQAFAYRDPDDQLPGVGWSWLELPGKTPYTRGSEVENAETSAWGRAIASLGILVDRSIASAQEVENKREPMTPASVNAQERERLAAQDFLPDGGLIGTVTTEGTKDGQLRETPNGWALPFKVKNGRKAYIVIAEDKMAQALATLWPTIVNQRVTVWGHWSEETIPAKGTKPEIHYKLLHLERIQTPDGTLPPVEDIGPEPPDDVELPFEAPTEPLFPVEVA
jgi:hypothetical protein